MCIYPDLAGSVPPADREAQRGRPPAQGNQTLSLPAPKPCSGLPAGSWGEGVSLLVQPAGEAGVHAKGNEVSGSTEKRVLG